jgi:hypothetical protein
MYTLYLLLYMQVVAKSDAENLHRDGPAEREGVQGPHPLPREPGGPGRGLQERERGHLPRADGGGATGQSGRPAARGDTRHTQAQARRVLTQVSTKGIMSPDEYFLKGL